MGGNVEPIDRRQVLGGISMASLLAGATFAPPSHGRGTLRSTHRLLYTKPASDWLEALPVGNGRIGAMVFGGVKQERIQLNHIELWSGRPSEDDRKESREALPKVRKLLFEGQYAEANKLAQDQIMTPMNDATYGSYQMLGDLRFDFDHADGEASYSRELDISAAAAKVSYLIGGHSYSRTILASFPDQALFVRLETTAPEGLAFSVSLSRQQDSAIAAEDGKIVMRGRPALGGVDFAAILACKTEGGQSSVESSGYRVKGAKSVTLILTAATSLMTPDAYKQCRDRMTKAQTRSWKAVLADHTKDYQRLFTAAELQLGDDVSQPLASSRLLDAKSGIGMPLMAEAYFNLGRYLFIASSRPGSLPPNLQGLWADGFNPPWSADYHININLQMNYWPAEVCGLGELTGPLFDYVDRLMPHARRTAEIAYGCRGAAAHYTSNPWGHVALDGKTQWGLWPDGLAWLSLHFWEHYLQTGDRTFLATRAYPVMKACAEFSLDYLVPHPRTGKLVAGPATSPENSYRLADGTVGYISMGPAMAQSIAFSVLNTTAQAARLLATDDAFAKAAETAAGKLERLRIGQDGRVMEWSEPFEEAEPGHRHISHLFGLYPGTEIDTIDTPELAEAARKTLAARLSHGGGHTGWSAAWLVMFRARLGEGDAANAMLEKLFRESTAANYFDTHPWGDGAIFQIDGNLGATAAMAEMLMQSHNNRLRLLPALPKAWQNGKVRGLKARGGIEVSVEWRDGRAVTASLRSASDTQFRLVAPPGQRFAVGSQTPVPAGDVKLSAGKALTLSFV
jgi:alpha-L-fucosidase 2